MVYESSREAEEHWRRVAKEMPPRRATIRCEDRYPADAFERLFTARLPGEMEDKWVALPGTEETVIDFHRSWTGFHVYRVYLFEDDDGTWYIDRVDVNREPAQYSGTDDAYDADVVRWLVRAIVLGEPVSFPQDPSLSGIDALLAAWGVGGAASLEDGPDAPPDRPEDSAPSAPSE